MAQEKKLAGVWKVGSTAKRKHGEVVKGRRRSEQARSVCTRIYSCDSRTTRHPEAAACFFFVFFCFFFLLVLVYRGRARAQSRCVSALKGRQEPRPRFSATRHDPVDFRSRARKSTPRAVAPTARRGWLSARGRAHARARASRVSV